MHWVPGWAAVTVRQEPYGEVLIGPYGENAFPRHFGGQNVTFVDGHVKHMKTSAVKADVRLWTIL